MNAHEDFAAAVLPQIKGMWSRLDPVPAGLTDNIKFAMTVRLLEAEVAEITQAPALASRGEAAEKSRSMTFTGSSVSLMVRVSDEGETLRLDCWITHGAAEIEMHAGDRVVSERSDEFGRLVFDDVPRGPVHFIVWPGHDHSARPLITPSIDL
jgi:hypothetical protein